MKNSSKAKAALDAQEKLPLDEDLDNENEEGDLSQEGMAESDAAMLEDAKANVAQDDLIGIVMGNDNPDANETGSAPEQDSEHEPEASNQQSDQDQSENQSAEREEGEEQEAKVSGQEDTQEAKAGELPTSPAAPAQQASPADLATTQMLLKLTNDMSVLLDRIDRIDERIEAIDGSTREAKAAQDDCLKLAKKTNGYFEGTEKRIDEAVRSSTQEAVKSLNDEFAKGMRLCAQKASESVNTVRKDAAETIDKVHAQAVDHIHELEQAASRRSRMYFMMNLPERLLNYAKYLAILIVLALALAFGIEHFV
jgi:hypothetical protein